MAFQEVERSETAGSAVVLAGLDLGRYGLLDFLGRLGLLGFLGHLGLLGLACCRFAPRAAAVAICRLGHLLIHRVV